MRVNRVMMAMGLLAAAVLMSGCASDLQQENDLLTEEVQGLRAQLTERNAALDAANRELREQDMTVAELRRQIDDLEGAAAAPAGRQTGFEGIEGVQGRMGAGQVTAIVEGDVLFDSGKTALKAAAQQSLNAIATVLNSTYAGRPVRVTGHTDTDPIVKSGFKSNYHLGFERAYAVREYLISRGVSATRLSLASFGPDRALSTKAQSRRVEIVVALN
ncbi:MAG: OmpA family protein [Phycisphaerales bacterium]|nr:MAG: OmpA family protein [Phycisphaerales bacterium]